MNDEWPLATIIERKQSNEHSTTEQNKIHGEMERSQIAGERERDGERGKSNKYLYVNILSH